MPWQLIPLPAVRPQCWQSTGSAAGSGVLAAAAGGLLAVKLYFRRIREWFRARFGEPPATEDQDPADRQS